MKKLFIAGHRGMVGGALVREAKKLGGYQVITATRDQLDLCDQSAVFDFLAREKPGIVIIAAILGVISVGGDWLQIGVNLPSSTVNILMALINGVVGPREQEEIAAPLFSHMNQRDIFRRPGVEPIEVVRRLDGPFLDGLAVDRDAFGAHFTRLGLGRIALDLDDLPTATKSAGAPRLRMREIGASVTVQILAGAFTVICACGLAYVDAWIGPSTMTSLEAS
ncbi:MAG: NAD-dependent epimerase/dehydratase family protein [Akkermansiaceae bacterium]|nr:NAD-dependent epimerase/dehydratase family protein [Akkermansiaceae bacterium]